MSMIDRFIESIKKYTPTISKHFKTNCEQPIMKEVVQSMKKGNSNCIYIFRSLQNPYSNCFKNFLIEKKTMKQRITTLIPKLNKAHLLSFGDQLHS